MIRCSFEEEQTFEDGSYRHSMCLNKAQILVLNDPCYGLCYQCAYQKVKAENEEFRQKLADRVMTLREKDWIMMVIENKRLERMEEALERIQTWARAYPLDIFPKPDLKKAHKILKAAGLTLDAISADAMRHVLDGIKDIVQNALEGESREPN